MSKQIEFSNDARQEIKKGVDLAVNTAKVTLGARGRNVLIDNDFGMLHPTKDGVTILKNITELETPLQTMGAKMVAQASGKVADEAGDGTTTTAILTQSIFNEGLKNIAAGTNPISLKEGINKGVAQVVEFLKTMSEDIDGDISKIRNVATISANNDPEIGNLIADAIDKVGYQAVITAEESKGTETYVDTLEGLDFTSGYLSPYFINNQEKMSVEMNRPALFLLDGTIKTVQSIVPLLKFANQTKTPLVIIANDIDGEVLATMSVNNNRGGISLAAVKAPYIGEKRKNFLQDIATLTEATIVADDSGAGFEDFDASMLGGCDKIIIKKDSTAIIDGSGTKEEINSRVEMLNKQLSEAKDPRDKQFLKERISKLSGGVAVMYVGANTQVELREKFDRVDDALSATRAAIEEGIVSGGGVTLLKAVPTIDFSKAKSAEELTGMSIIAKAIKEPFLQIIRNAGTISPEVAMAGVLEKSARMGYDVKAGEYVDMKDAGIIDPTKVTRTALESAASVANILLTTEATITNSKKGLE